jgi:hypothetical protein
MLGRSFFLKSQQKAQKCKKCGTKTVKRDSRRAVIVGELKQEGRALPSLTSVGGDSESVVCVDSGVTCKS